ncbi:o-succinylbenzoate synthase [Rhodococcus sp. X156]|uniref:o-succinylbenzoate synthase n=1 Tax=Rhodococcus sp. X156 TaxID=2499145 RepID=UPI000FD8E05A|nr:o-succinylbenzoate synthase [Rhodococcus sp. X156]
MSSAVSPSAVPLPSLDEVVAQLHVVALPLQVRFRGIDVREVSLLRGPAGWGEFAPFTEYDDAESAWWLAAALESAWWGPPPALREQVTVNATVPAVPAEQVPAVLARFPGCTTAKVKVAERGQALADDLARVAAVRRLVPTVRVDANGGWAPHEALGALVALHEQGPLEYAEQPCASVAELADLRVRLRAAGADVPVAADESIRRAEDPLRVAQAGAADVAVLKVPPLGGMRRVLALARVLRREHGLPVVVSSALDSAVGIGAGLAAAAALPDLEHACGLATGGLLTEDVTAPVRPVGGVLPVRSVHPDLDRLQALAVAPDREHWWRERISRAHARLAAGHPAWPPPGVA